MKSLPDGHSIPSNGILSVITLRCSPINIILRFTTALPPFHSSSSPPNSLRLLLRLLSSLSPPSLPHAPYAENCAVIIIGINRNRIRGGSQKKEIGKNRNKLPQKKAPPELEQLPQSGYNRLELIIKIKINMVYKKVFGD